MSSFYRKGTVSKSSGPTHINSYALRGIPIKYKPPIYVPEPLYLPADWRPPEIPSEDKYRYDYATERSVLSQARSRALSIAAEASLHRKQVEDIQRQQREEEEAKAAQESTSSHPPVTFSNDILTPIPVSTAATTTPVVADILPEATEQTSKEESPKSTSQTSIELSTEPPIKSLGQMSIREFENNFDDPFEIASLQAINDMEVLQSVLQPIPPPIVTSNVPSTTSVTVTSSPLTQPSSVAPVSGLTGTATTVSQSTPVPMPRTKTGQTSPSLHKSSAPYLSTTPPTAIPPIQTAALSSQQPNSVPQSGVLIGGVTAVTYADPLLTNSHTSTVAVPNVLPVVGSPNNARLMTGAPSSFEPGIGLLVDIGDHAPPKTVEPPGRSKTLPAVRLPYSVQVDQPQGSQFPPSPVPKPRTHIPSSVSSSGTSPQPNSSQLATPPLSTAQGRPSPPVPPKGNRHVVTPTQDAVGGAPSVPPKGIKPGGVGQIGFALPSNSQTQGLNCLPGLGVQVLPPISKPQPAANQGIPPPTHSSPPTQPRVPPPYSSPKPSSRSPLVAPRPYKLSDPQANLSSEQKSEVESLSGMGFPPARVARAVLKCAGDRSKVLDFLFLVGQVEEEHYAGDSAETALLACKEDPAKAVEYLKKVEGFKNIGFLEKNVHEAYEKSDGDWDKALDFLTEDR